MSRPGDDTRRLRELVDLGDDDLSQGPETDGAGSAGLAAVTVNQGAYPTKPLAFYACTRQAVTGDEIEGKPVSLKGQNGTLYAANLGSTVPPVGAKVLLVFVPWRWVFSYDGPTQ